MISKAIFETLEKGFRAPRPGSNFFPLLSLKVGDDHLDGEEIEKFIRDGFLTASPLASEGIVAGGDCGPHGIIPDIDLTHVYKLTKAGRAALGPQ